MTTDTQKPIRSPSYPSMSLRDAISKVAIIEANYRASAVDRTVGAKLIGFNSLSGPANMALAALAAYGLIERAGKGEMRVTDRARAILHADSEGEKIAQLRAASIEPDLFRELQDRFPGILPPEDGVITFLNRKQFNASAVRPAAKAFLETMKYLEEFRASDSHGKATEPAPESRGVEREPPAATYGGAKVGDLVQWESQGAPQFLKPQRVRMVTKDGQWIAVEGSESGIPMSQVIVESSAPIASNPIAPIFPLEGSGSPDDAAKGEVEWMRNKVGQDTNIRLLVRGEMGPKEIGKLIKILEAQKLVLED